MAIHKDLLRIYNYENDGIQEGNPLVTFNALYVVIIKKFADSIHNFSHTLVPATFYYKWWPFEFFFCPEK